MIDCCEKDVMPAKEGEETQEEKTSLETEVWRPESRDSEITGEAGLSCGTPW